MNQVTIVLGSGSRYRAAQLERLGLPFITRAPEVDETPRAYEPPPDRARRLAREKAVAVAQHYPEATVIGSDQVAACRGALLRKPGSTDAQQTQLTQMAGQCVEFFTAVCILGPSGSDFLALDHTQAWLRSLQSLEIKRYVQSEPAVDCAGGFKVEGLGISLFERIVSQDPTALIGLPLIAVADGLRQQGLLLP